MDYLEEVLEGEDKIRKSEGKARKDIPPPGMDDQAWNIDRFYLQYMLKLKARQVHYSNWSPEEKVHVKDTDFEAMEAILRYRKGLVEKDRLIMAYLRTISAMQLDPENEDTPLAIEQVLIKVVNDRPEMGVEDYVYLTTYLSNYALVAQGKKQGDYARLVLISQIPTLEAKYGTSWKEGDQKLAYRFLVNLALSAMSFAGKEVWRGLTMDLVKDIGEDGTVFDWVEEVLKAYESRLEADVQKPTLAYVRANSAFFQNDYTEAAEQLILIGKMPLDFLGVGIMQLRLMTYYELLYCQGVSGRPLARNLEPNVKKTIKGMRDYLKDLETRQGRKTFIIQVYLTFIDNFSELLTLKEQAERLTEGSDQRFRYLFKPRAKLLKGLEKYDYFAGKWLRNQLKVLQ